MSSASRRVLMTCCSVSLSLLTTRSWSPWMRTCNFAETFWIRLRRSRATTSNEYSATRVQDGLHSDHDRRNGQRHPDKRADREQRADASGGLVERFGRRLAERVRAVVEVVNARSARPGAELIDDRLAAGRDGLRAHRLKG